MAQNLETISELTDIARLNGDFRRNYGRLLGAFLYLRSINAARGRCWLWGGALSIVSAAAMTWLGKQGFFYIQFW